MYGTVSKWRHSCIFESTDGGKIGSHSHDMRDETVTGRRARQARRKERAHGWNEVEKLKDAIRM